MPKKLKPVIRYNRSKTDGLFDSQYSSHNVAFLCIPLTPASRKALIDTIEEAFKHQNHKNTFRQDAEAALDALIKLANQEQP